MHLLQYCFPSVSFLLFGRLISRLWGIDMDKAMPYIMTALSILHGIALVIAA